jgi:hypothetical protein
MSPKRDDPTFDSVRKRHGEWREDNPIAPYRSALDFSEGLPIPELKPSVAKWVFLVMGLGIGTGLLALAAVSLAASRSWTEAGRDGAALGYALPVLFLLVSGLGCILATYNHNFKVMNAVRGHH